MLRVLKKWMVVVFSSAVIMACSASATEESTGQFLDSSAITAKVKAQLIDQLGAKGFNIMVKTYKDEVQLSGFVNSQAIKRRAGEAAARVKNVKQVRNNLIVK